MGAHSRVLLVPAAALSALVLGYPGPPRRAAGTDDFAEDEPCPHCPNGTLKSDAEGLFCKSCKRRPSETR